MRDMVAMGDLRRPFGARQSHAFSSQGIEERRGEIEKPQAPQRRPFEIRRAYRRDDVRQSHRSILNGQDAHRALVSMWRGAGGIMENTVSALKDRASSMAGVLAGCPTDSK